jgi:hypothetical protein
MPNRIEREREAAFATLCAKLKANSSTVKHVHVPPNQRELEHVDKWAVQMSSALLNGTVVSEISMHMSYISGQDDVVNPFLPYLRTNPTLRIVHFEQPSWSTTLPPFTVDLCGQLLSAIADNTSVDELALNVKVPIESILHCLGGLRAFRLYCLPHWYTPLEFSQIGHAMKDNLGLQILNLCETCDMEPLLQGLVSHPALRQLTLGRKNDTSSFPMNVLGNLIGSSPTLERLCLSNYSFTVEAAEHIISGLRRNRSVVELQLAVCTFRIR